MEKKSHFWQQMSEYLPVTLLPVVAYGEAMNFFHLSPMNVYPILKESTSRSCRSASASTPTDLMEPFSINTQNSCTGVPLPYCLQSQSSCYWSLTGIALWLPSSSSGKPLLMSERFDELVIGEWDWSSSNKSWNTVVDLFVPPCSRTRLRFLKYWYSIWPHSLILRAP